MGRRIADEISKAAAGTSARETILEQRVLQLEAEVRAERNLRLAVEGLLEELRNRYLIAQGTRPRRGYDDQQGGNMFVN